MTSLPESTPIWYCQQVPTAVCLMMIFCFFGGAV